MNEAGNEAGSVTVGLPKPANAEMVEGYLDGFDLTAPEPSANRSESYKHGFANGRSDKTGATRGLTLDQLIGMADAAMDADERRNLQ